MPSQNDDVIISVIETQQDIIDAYHCVAEAFGTQIQDALWMLTNPGWDTEEGRARNAHSLIKLWQTTTTNKNGQPNDVCIKATIPHPEKPGERKVAGMAIWRQLSNADGYGTRFSGDMTEATDHLDEKKRRFALQMYRSLWKRRIEVMKEVSTPEAGRDPPAIFTLEICAVDPAFQRRGIAGKLVEWGLEEAKKRGNLECTTEGSVMGRGVYRKLGFRDEGVGDIQWDVDEEFKDWDKPPNVFLRTRAF